jgi:hypothetical protein
LCRKNLENFLVNRFEILKKSKGPVEACVGEFCNLKVPFERSFCHFEHYDP